MKRFTHMTLLIIGSLFLSACQPPPASGGLIQGIKILAIESFLADIAQNVVGDQRQVEALVPLGIDPHAFEPTPRDVARIAESKVLIINGAGLEDWLAETIQNAGGDRILVEAAAGLPSRKVQFDEGLIDSTDNRSTEPGDHSEVDPHFWLDPLNVIHYVENIRDGLIAADPAAEDIYTRNASVYITRLTELDSWIRQQVSVIPESQRLMVTNHESFGYFADRYSFQIIGAIVPSVSAAASPSAQQMTRLVEQIRAAGAPAIFLETGASSQLAEQIALETGAKVVTGLYTHSLTGTDGSASTYIDLMKYNTLAIVEALR